MSLEGTIKVEIISDLRGQIISTVFKLYPVIDFIDPMVIAGPKIPKANDTVTEVIITEIQRLIYCAANAVIVIMHISQLAKGKRMVHRKRK